MLSYETAETDVLVVGSGLAGMSAAIAADQKGVSVLLVTKGLLGKSGCSPNPVNSAGVGPWSMAGDSTERHFKDIIIGGKFFLCDQRLAKILAEGTGKRWLELEELGLLFDRDENGDIRVLDWLVSPTSGLKRHTSIDHKGMGVMSFTGLNMVKTLKAELIRRDIRFIEETIVTKLLRNECEVTGAVALDYCNGRFLAIRAKSIVLATGGAGQLYYPHTITSKEDTGDGFALALNAGAELMDLEQMEACAVQWANPDSLRRNFLTIYMWYPRAGLSAYLVNRNGERFMKRYDPDRMELTRYHTLIRGMCTEIEEGRGPIYLDLRHVPRHVIEEETPFAIKYYEHYRYDPEKELAETAPTMFSSSGGVRINEKCESSLSGLFAAGQVAAAIGDVMEDGGTGTNDALVFGDIAGKSAAERAANKQMPEIDSKQVEEEIKRVSAPLERNEGISPLRVVRNIQGVMWNLVGILKSQEKMENAMAELQKIRSNDLPQMATVCKSKRYNDEWLEAVEAENLLEIAVLVTRASLMRKESRGRMFMRYDYPDRDDENWLKHILVVRSGEQTELLLIPVEFPYVKPSR